MSFQTESISPIDSINTISKSGVIIFADPIPNDLRPLQCYLLLPVIL